MAHRCKNNDWIINVKQQENFYLKTNKKSESNLAISMKIEDNILMTIRIKHDGKIRLLMKVKPKDKFQPEFNMELEHNFGSIMNTNHLNTNIKHFPPRS